MQRAYITALCELAQNDSRVLSLLADSGTGYDEMFRKYFPDQLLDFGIAEENMVSAAAGMAMCGKIPFVYTAGAFLAYRSYEFIRDDICYQNLNVKLVGMGTGLAWSTLGATHHTTEDLSLLRALPNMTVITPSCPREVIEAVKAAYEIQGPVYIRIGMNAEPDLYDDTYAFSLNKGILLRDGTDGVIFTCGSIAGEAVKSAELLAETQNVSLKVVNIPVISPLESDTILKEIDGIKRIIIVEEHSITGGLGSAVCEIIAETGLSAKVKRIGLDHVFAHGYGTQDQLRTQNGLDAEQISKKIKNWI